MWCGKCDSVLLPFDFAQDELPQSGRQAVEGGLSPEQFVGLLTLEGVSMTISHVPNYRFIAHRIGRLRRNLPPAFAGKLAD